MQKSVAEHLLYCDLVSMGWKPETEYSFHPRRRWRFDLCYPDPAILLAIEIEGSGRHGTDKGQRSDCEKYNAALESGWRLLRYPASSISVKMRRERIVEQIGRVLHRVHSPEDSGEVLT